MKKQKYTILGALGEGFSGGKSYFVRLDSGEHKNVLEYNIEKEWL